MDIDQVGIENIFMDREDGIRSNEVESLFYFCPAFDEDGNIV